MTRSVTHYAITGMTAAELIQARADSSQPNMGLTSWKGEVVRKTDVTIAKRYSNGVGYPSPGSAQRSPGISNGNPTHSEGVPHVAQGMRHTFRVHRDLGPRPRAALRWAWARIPRTFGADDGLTLMALA